MDIPFRESWLLDIGLVILLIILSLIIIFFLRRMLDFFRKKDNKKYKQEGCFGCLFKLLFLNVLFWFGMAIIALAAFIQSFHSFTKQKLVAEVTCEKIDYNDYTMRFSISQKYGANAGTPIQLYLRGDKWFVEGDILKWSAWANFFGLHTMYRIRRVGGVYWRTEDELKRPRTIKSLVRDEVPYKWIWLYKFGSSLPIIQDVYGISISKTPAYNKKFKIFVTTSGFSTETIDKE